MLITPTIGKVICKGQKIREYLRNIVVTLLQLGNYLNLSTRAILTMDFLLIEPKRSNLLFCFNSTSSLLRIFHMGEAVRHTVET